MNTSDDYRAQAAEQNAAARSKLEGLDEARPNDKLLLGVIGAIKASVFTATADILDAIERNGSPKSQYATRNHRLRMAAIRNDNAAIERIMKEFEDELLAKQRESTGIDGGQGSADDSGQGG